MHAEYLNTWTYSTLIEVTLKGVEDVSKAYSVVSLHSHRQPNSQRKVGLDVLAPRGLEVSRAVTQ